MKIFILVLVASVFVRADVFLSVGADCRNMEPRAITGIGFIKQVSFRNCMSFEANSFINVPQWV